MDKSTKIKKQKVGFEEFLTGFSDRPSKSKSKPQVHFSAAVEEEDKVEKKGLAAPLSKKRKSRDTSSSLIKAKQSNGSNLSSKKSRTRNEDIVRDINIEAEDVADYKEEDNYANDDDDEEEEDEEDSLSMKKHRDELKSLATKDPAFYEYMQKNSANLLEFGDEEEEDEKEEDDEEDGDEDEEAGILEREDEENMDQNDEEEEEGGRATMRKDAQLLTIEQAREISKLAFDEKDIRGLQRAVKAFRAACFSGDSAGLGEISGGSNGGVDDFEDDGGMSERKRKRSLKASDHSKHGKAKPTAELTLKHTDRKLRKLHFRISSSKVFHFVITDVIKRAGAALVLHLGAVKGADAKTPDTSLICPEGVQLSKFSGYSRVSSLAKSIIVCALHLLESSSEPSMLTFILRGLRLYLPFCQGHGSLSRKLTRSMLSLFSSNDDSGVRVAAYMRVRQCALALPYPSIDKCLKGAYMSFVRATKSVSVESLPNLQLMANCVAELYGIDEASSYTHAFIYLRQLAIHLRTAITTRTEQSMSTVLSWQFTGCLNLWTHVICKFAQDSRRPLFQLIYPLVQIIIGASRLHPAARYYPMRLHLCRYLIEISWATGVYIPVAPMILQVLRSTLTSSKGKSSASAAASSAAAVPPLSILVKATASVQATRAYQDALVSQCFELLLDYLRSQFFSIAFPEIMAPCALSLRKFAKETRVGHWRVRAKALVDTITAQAIKVATKRSSFDGAPTDKEACARFMESEADSLRRERQKEMLAAAVIQNENRGDDTTFYVSEQVDDDEEEEKEFEDS